MAAVRDVENSGPRAQGPSVVWSGQDAGPALVVMDPFGAARHEGLPATWRSLADEYQVVWCRVPASSEMSMDVEDVLESLEQQQVMGVDLIAAGEVCEMAIALAARFAPTVRSVLLVDPGPLGSELHAGVAATSELADAAWQTETLEDRRWLAEAGVPIRVVARSAGGQRDRVPPPLPLGHPDVVDSVRAALRATDQDTAGHHQGDRQ